MRMYYLVGLLLLSSLTLACGGAGLQRDGFVVEADEMEDAERNISRRASFDLGCDRSQLTLTLLGVHDDAGADMPTQIGVRGCGKQATYIRHIIDGPGMHDAETGWEMDAAGIAEQK